MGNRENKANLFLIGFSGSGKSSVGKQLAIRLDYNFIDTDRIIEENTGQTIDETLRFKGEKEFRKIETRVLSEIDYSKKNIIATGGGIPTIDKNIKIMQNEGSIIWLKASINSIFSRLFKSKEIRPLLGSNVKKENINNLFNSRLNVYNIADNTIDTNDKKIEQIINEITKIYGK
ncbi:MAG: shikimate kinase [Chloroflexota bacterium]|nr:shikimate kinase [Chloroflexota bacterium]